MNALAALDRQLFLLINGFSHIPFLDTVALFLSGVGTAGIIWFVIGAVLFFKEEKKDHRFFAPLFLAGGASWVLVEILLKPWVARLRPTVEMGAIIVGATSESFSFPSGHATIAFAMAAVLSKKEPSWTKPLYALALLISLSRIYLGLHYPLDVIAGGVIGWSIGRLSRGV